MSTRGPAKKETVADRRRILSGSMGIVMTGGSRLRARSLALCYLRDEGLHLEDIPRS